MKTILYYLRSLPISLGFILFFRSVYCLIDTIQHIGHPVKGEFWDFYLKSFRDWGVYFVAFSLLILSVVIILLNRLRRSPEKT